MRIIVDTCIWSLALRRKNSIEDSNSLELKQLISESRIQMLGQIRQELLSGIKSKVQFETLKQSLSEFPDLEMNPKNYEQAAEYFNLCRSKGIQGSNTDFLICAIVAINEIPIFTTDKDFLNFKKYLPIKLHKSRF